MRLRPRIHSASRARAELRARALLERNGRYAGVPYQAAVRARALSLARQRLKQQVGATSPEVINWTEIGPGNVGGRVNAVWVDPSNSQHLLAGSASGGLWQSSDGGGSWSAVSEFPGALTIGTIAQTPDGTLLVGTGDAFTAAGDGMFSSTDGGATWTPVSSTAPSSNGSFWLLVNAIAVCSKSVILASTYGGIARSTDGQTWAKVWKGDHSNRANSMDVVCDPQNPQDAVADNENGGVVYSTDAGQTWLTAVGLPGTSNARVSLAFDPDPAVAGSVYALVDNGNETSPSGEVFHSSDDGATWTQLAGTGAFVNADSGKAVGALCDDAIAGPTECQGSYDNVILVRPHSSGTQPTVIVGGIDIFTSTDGGTTWTETGSWLATDSDYIHADQHAFNDASGTLYVGNDGGFYKQGSPGTWSQHNEGLAVTQFYGVAGHAGTTASKDIVDGAAVTPIVAGAQDNGTLLYQGYSAGGAPQPDDWVPIFGGDGGFTQVDAANGNDVYGEYVYLSLFYSSAGGPMAVNYQTLPPDSNDNAADFIAPYVLVPNNGAVSDQMLAGGASVWRGTDIQAANPMWTAINESGMPAKTTDSNDVSAIAVDPQNGNDAWVGYDDGEIWRSSNALAAAPSWSRVDSAAQPGRTVQSLWVVPGQTSTVYVTFDGYPASGEGSNVWMTTDAGGSWTDIGSGLPPAPVYSLVTHPAYPQILYAGTLVGVFTSRDSGQSWSASNRGPANVEVRQLTWFDESNAEAPTLLAATFGRGAWLGSPTYNPTPALTSVSPSEITVRSISTEVTLTGSGFEQGITGVTLDGLPISVSYQSATQLQATVPASAASVLGTHTFVASNPIPGGGASAGANLVVGNPAPTLTSISPGSAQAGSNPLTLTASGSGFVADSTVYWNGNALTTTYVSATALSAFVPASDLSSAANAQITVVTSQPGGGTSAGTTFTVEARSGGGGALTDIALLLLLGANVWAGSRARIHAEGSSDDLAQGYHDTRA